jgi:hypothetical protein
MDIKDVLKIFHLPRVTINLMEEKTEHNYPFYREAVLRFYREATAPHTKWPFAQRYQYGYSLCALPKDFDTYFRQLDSSARNNYRKALRRGYTFERIDFNTHLEAIRNIWKSCTVRQGKMPDKLLLGQVEPIENPPSQTAFQDYPYFGVFKHQTLVAYGACLVSGELCSVHDLFGHAQFLEDGIVPMTLIDIAREIYTAYPTVKYYGYGTYFGASESLRRFKRKFLFHPYRVTWKLRSVSNKHHPVLGGLPT